ncbi:ABC transporter ATP-binding protein [Rugamonas rivuli]|uniref:ATP-binding cassette domain-containing protein n=1 Tax=Rugamonas rivuli TaxID=2743358 RepID=A0A843SI04_9BURK|nr:ATP-binding cassette domain-containing protein [Rugamonas rivuli]MQA21634.1 ATP-binding cassette domain-containing protein [Rugamonas rivuli]
MIEAVGLKKDFKSTAKGAKGQTVQAVKSVSFTCRPGQVLGLIGPNGAGKTTTLRMLSSAIAPTAGEVRVQGLRLTQEQMDARRQIGFLSGHTGLYQRLSVRENIEYFGRAYGLRGAALSGRTDQLIDQFGLRQYADQQVDKLSFGNKQRAAIARTVVHTPAILILDEPTTGLDILGAKLVNDFVLDYKRSGAAVIFSTHHMHEVEDLCDEVCIINSGVSVYEGQVAALLNETGTTSLHGAYLHKITTPQVSA